MGLMTREVQFDSKGSRSANVYQLHYRPQQGQENNIKEETQVFGKKSIPQQARQCLITGYTPVHRKDKGSPLARPLPVQSIEGLYMNRQYDEPSIELRENKAIKNVLPITYRDSSEQPTHPGIDIQSKSPPSLHEHDIIQQLFGYWQLLMKRPHAKLDNHRRYKIKQALQLGYSLEELKTAIRGCSKTPFNVGDNPNKQYYNDITLIFRDASHIERFVDKGKGECRSASCRQNNELLEGVL